MFTALDQHPVGRLKFRTLSRVRQLPGSVPTLVLSLLIIWAGMPTYLAKGERLKHMAALACAIVTAELVALLLRRRARRKFLDSCTAPVQVHSRSPIFEGRTTLTGFALAHSPSPAFRQEPNARTLGWQWLPFSAPLSAP